MAKISDAAYYFEQGYTDGVFGLGKCAVGRPGSRQGRSAVNNYLEGYKAGCAEADRRRLTHYDASSPSIMPQDRIGTTSPHTKGDEEPRYRPWDKSKTYRLGFWDGYDGLDDDPIRHKIFGLPAAKNAYLDGWEDGVYQAKVDAAANEGDPLADAFDIDTEFVDTTELFDTDVAEGKSDFNSIVEQVVHGRL